MIKKLKNILLAVTGLSMLLAPALIPATSAYALSQSDITGGLTCGVQGQIDQTGACQPDTTGPTLTDTFAKIINIFSVIVGVIAVIMIIFGGLRYIISGGDSGNISGAKNTIIFALVGLIIVALAQVIVHFVLSRVGG